MPARRPTLDVSAEIECRPTRIWDDPEAATGAPAGRGLDHEAREHVRAVTVASGSSFYWAMRLMPPERRDAMFAIYAFCREVDDIADGDGSPAEKRRRLDAWRAEIAALYDGRPKGLTARALLGPVEAFELQRADFLAVIDGMAMDVDSGLVAPSLAELELYCQRVAGAVGLLSIRAFGARGRRAEAFALALGSALQLTNILRDLKQDAADGRLYLPRELLEASGIEARTPADVLADPALPGVCAALAATARTRFAEAEAALADCPIRPLRPAIVMMMNYRLLLDRLERRGWRDLDGPVGIPKLRKIWIALRYGFLG